MKVSILGGSGYIGGELLRLLLGHPQVEVAQVTSDALASKPVTLAHPNLRGRTSLGFTRHGELSPCDVLFLSGQHGYAMNNVKSWSAIAPTVIDLSADFRLKDPAQFEIYYQGAHQAPDQLPRFVPGIPEIARRQLETADRIAVPGCMATPSMLALYPFAREGLLTGTVHVDARTGSSGSGAQSSPGTHHADRSGAMRVFCPAGHRHEAEIAQICHLPVIMSATGVEAVRGVQVMVRVQLSRALDERQVHTLLRDYYGQEPFIRIIRRDSGVYRLPEPKLLSGTNYCDLGFALPSARGHLILIGAVDNLVKGGAGAAVQSMNVRFGWQETSGLEFPGLHPL